MISTLPASVIQLFLTYPHVPDETRMKNHRNSYLVSINLTFVLPRKFNIERTNIFAFLYTSIAPVTYLSDSALRELKQLYSTKRICELLFLIQDS